MYKYPYLADSAFLEFFDELKLKEQYIKINILNFREKFIKAIHGKVMNGNINIDGKSSMRRTANITILAEEQENDLTNVDYDLSINKKIELEIGFKNITGKYLEYPILWFPQGIYVIVAPSITHSVTAATISLQLKDKMCLLNGECGGTLPASVIFHEKDTFDEQGNYMTVKPPIYQIIQELVHHWGNEQLGKIIISDVDLQIKQVMKWLGSTPIYIGRENIDNQIQYGITTDEAEGQEKGFLAYDFGEDIGYVYTDFTYPGELIGDAGATVCEILDTIKNTLGNYEYFYDIEGNFVFQEIKNYLNTSLPTFNLENMNKNNYLVDFRRDKSTYNFSESNLISSFSNSPQYSMVKNDFVVWGLRKNVEGIDLPIRYHLAIDSKPKAGNTYKVFFYEDPEDGIEKAKKPIDIDKYSNLPKVGAFGVFYYTQDTDTIYKWDGKNYVSLPYAIETITTTDWRTELYFNGVNAEGLAVDGNYYYTELLNEWPKIYDIRNGKFKDTALADSSKIDFFLDFIDSTAAISELNISNIGRRTKVLNDDTINCLFEPEIPNLVLINLADDPEVIEEKRNMCILKGNYFAQVPESIFKMLSIGGSLNSAYVAIRSLLYQHTSYNETVTLQSLPVYHLEPNTRITVRDMRTNIYGEYIINSISLPLDVSGTMNISCVRALERI